MAARSEMTHVDDIECGRTSAVISHDEASCVCLSKGEEEGSCYSQFYLTAHADGSCDDHNSDREEIGEVADSGRVSSAAAASDCSVVVVDIQNGGVGDGEVKLKMDGKEERDCRICHMSLESDSPESGGIAIQLGCCCKDDLAAVHRQCAETWFKFKGNKICEICNSIARNVTGASEVDLMQQANQAHSNARATNTASTANQNGLIGHGFLIYLLAFLATAFVISLLLHFNIQA